MKGIILAGGSGTRLYPITKGVSKQLLPIYDKPMIYYPLSVLMLADIKDILVISTPDDIGNFKRLLGDGSTFGINLTYKVQEKPEGIAQAFLIGKEFIGDDSVALVLGDNIFHGNGFSCQLKNAKTGADTFDMATIFTYQVEDPERYGVATINNYNKVTSIEEKPKKPKSNYAVVGLYFYPKGVSSIVEGYIKPSERGELEITSLNEYYRKNDLLLAQVLGRGFAWLDTGTHDSLIEASNYVETIENRQGYKIACLEEIAYNKGWISKDVLLEEGEKMKNNKYGQYLLKIGNREQ